MPTVVVIHKVGDFDTWMTGHQDRVEVFGPAVTGFRTFRDSKDPNTISLVMDVTDMEQARRDHGRSPRPDPQGEAHRPGSHLDARRGRRLESRHLTAVADDRVQV
jgi:hypothetical protein